MSELSCWCGYVAQGDNLTVKTVQGDMRDLSFFEDESFDLIVHSLSNVFVDTVLSVVRVGLYFKVVMLSSGDL